MAVRPLAAARPLAHGRPLGRWRGRAAPAAPAAPARAPGRGGRPGRRTLRAAAPGLGWLAGLGARRAARRRGAVARGRGAGGAGGARQPEASVATLLAVGAVYLAVTVLNKILFRVTLIPMGAYTHLLGITTNMVYVLYFWRNCRLKAAEGALPQEAWDYSLRGKGKWMLLGSGLTQAVAFTVMPLFARQLPGSIVTVIGQAMLPFSMALSAVFLGRRFDMLQFLGVAIVVVGIAVCIYPEVLAEAANTMGNQLVGSAPFVLSILGLLLGYFFNGCCYVFKEAAVIRYEEDRPSERLSGDVVNFLTSLWQCAALWLLWPFNFACLTPLSPGQYFSQAWSVVQVAQNGGLILAYWLLNVYYVFITLKAIMSLSSVVVLLLSTLSVPLVTLIFCLPLPWIGAAPFSWYSVAGVFIIFGGVMIYEHQQFRSLKKS